MPAPSEPNHWVSWLCSLSASVRRSTGRASTRETDRTLSPKDQGADGGVSPTGVYVRLRASVKGSSSSLINLNTACGPDMARSANGAMGLGTAEILETAGQHSGKIQLP